MENNLPVQLFDSQDDTNILPKGLITNHVEGMRRISSDRSRYLDIVKPGRLHHFNSHSNLLYWQRYIDSKDAHEIDQGTIQDFSPFVCFFNGSSIFHHFAADIKLLKTVTDAIETKGSKGADPVLKMIP